MNIIDKYFRQFADKLSYIELKENFDKYKQIGLNDLPLPIILDEMMDGISSKNFENEISIEYIINGILYNIAIDPEFMHINEYKDILSKLIDDPSKFAMAKVMKFMETDKQKSMLYNRAAFILNERNEFAAYSYARILWTLPIDKEEKHVYVEQAVRILERILSYNDKYPLAAFELGNIFRSTGDYIKANSYYNMALRASENEQLNEQIRNYITEISPDVAVENAIYYLNRMNYSTAIDSLMDARKQSSRYDIPYYIAIAYMNNSNPQMAEQFFEEAIDKGADFATLYTDYVYIKYILNKPFEAIEIANQAIDQYPSEIKLRYNRAVINVAQGRNDKANEDLDFILEYQDLSDEMFNQIMKIKEAM